MRQTFLRSEYFRTVSELSIKCPTRRVDAIERLVFKFRHSQHDCRRRGGWQSQRLGSIYSLRFRVSNHK